MSPCSGCRAALCCASDFPLFEGEAERIRPHVPTRALARIRRDRTLLEPRTTGHRCPMLDDDNSCAIYEHRPEVCRRFVGSGQPAPSCMRWTPDYAAQSLADAAALRVSHGMPVGGWYDTITGWP